MHTQIMSSGSGYLELIIGPMYSGKTSRIIELYKQYKFCNIPVVVINHEIDNRYDSETDIDVKYLYTHDKIKVPCTRTDKLMSIWKDNNKISKRLHNSDVILINEGQFFDDLYEVVIEMVTQGKKVYISGLDGDFERKKFGRILDLIPLCDSVTKLTSYCGLCKNGTKAIFSLRLISDTNQTLVGHDIYTPVCRSCYDSKK